MNPLSILIADDDEDSLFLKRRSLLSAGIHHLVEEARDGEAVVTILRNRIRRQAPLPLFVLLDLYMPKLDGLSALRWIREQRELDGVPVAILSGSLRPDDMKKAFEMGADAYYSDWPDIEGVTMLYQRAKQVHEGMIAREGMMNGLPGAALSQNAQPVYLRGH